MYLSRIKLNTSLRKTMQALAAPNLFHGAIENCEIDKRTRKLWRVDTLRGEMYLLILSEKAIDFSDVANQFGYKSGCEMRNYDSFIERITDGSKWHFRLRANPVIHKKSSDGKRGKVIAHITPKHQGEWLKRQAEKNGFSLEDGQWGVADSKWHIFKKNREEKHEVRILSVTYEGILTVTDTDLFRKALVNGIGREKAFGQGLLTVTRADR